MKLVMTLLVRDEEDIVDSTVRFHLERGVDLVLVTDNLSLDRTRDLLREFERTGAVRVWSEPNDQYRQWEWVSRMAQAAASEYSADWVMHCDADEFWWTDQPLPSIFRDVPAQYDVVVAPRHDFLPLRPDSDEPFYERMTVRDTDPRNILGRPLLGKCAHRAADDVVVAQGNHFVVNERMTQAPDPPDALILHFPVRTYRQLERKVVLGGRAYARNPDLPPTVGNTWRALFQAYLDGTLRDYVARQVPDEDDLATGLRTGRYVADTRLRNVLRRWAPPRTLSAEDAEPAPPTRARPALRAVAAAAAGSSTAQMVVADVEARLIDFIDGTRAALDVVAGGLTACGVSAALASARQRGVALRLLTETAAPLRSWQLHTVLRCVGPPRADALLLRDGRDIWTGPAALDAATLHGPDPVAHVVPRAPNAGQVRRRVDALWAQAVPVPPAGDRLIAGGWG